MGGKSFFGGVKVCYFNNSHQNLILTKLFNDKMWAQFYLYLLHERGSL